MYPRDLNKIKWDITDDVLTLVTAYLMDEMDYDEQKIVDLGEGIARYSKAEKDHYITRSKVKKIIEENTGIKLLGYKKNGNVETNT